MSTVQTPRMLTVQEVADRLAITRSAVYYLIHSDNPSRLPAIRLGSQYRIDPHRFERWLIERGEDR